jgi:DNA modification methylase
MNETQNIEHATQPDLTGMRCYNQPLISLFNEDCRETMKRIPDGSVDLMLTDPPYNTTNCDWEYEINLAMLWPEWERILKPNGICAIFCNEPFTSDLIISRRSFFKYKWIWDKDSAAGFLNAYKMPLTGYEEIVIFSRAKMGNHTYNAQITDKAKNLVRPPKTDGKEYSATYNKFKSLSREKDTSKAFPKNIITIGKNEAECNSLNRFHPTQKPVDLMRYLLLTYSNKGETVFDGYSGSGTTAHACLLEGRKFIGSELDSTYFEKSVKRLQNVPTQLF